MSSTNESSHTKSTVFIEVALDALKTTQLYRAKCTHTGGTSAHLFDLSSSVVKAFQELVLNLTIYSTSSFTATGVHFHGCCSAGIWLIHFVPLSEYLVIWLIIYTQFCVFQKTEAETKTKTKTVPGPKWPLTLSRVAPSAVSKGQGGIKCGNRGTGFLDSEGSHR